MWQEKDKQLYRKFELKDFKAAFKFMAKVADEAEKQNHHPRWQNDWNEVEIWLSTHTKGKITNKDHKLARAIDAAYKAQTKGSSKASLIAAKLYTDGGSRGNPGPSAGAFIICNLDNNVVEKSGFYIGIATNNQAEYQALVKGLERAKKVGVKELIVHMDSELVIKQINGLYKIKNNLLQPLHQQIEKLARTFESIKFVHVPRILNNQADTEVNRILDEQERRKS
ncbi:4a-hydroxytetrahydrobiopterin dehydratase [Candidatus Saccharibacteria bacterium]|nr:4a-hydroxytetrahydrobiopterin dehydratase [Candidatus Saccharibacteria bacterium]